MFDVFCSRHSRRVLLFARHIRAIDNRPDGIHVHWRCDCGEEGMWLTGRRESA